MHKRITIRNERTIVTALVLLLLSGIASIGRADDSGDGADEVEPLRILTSTNDLAAIARAVCAEQAEIEVVLRRNRDPHSVEVRPSTMRKAAGADYYLAVGLSLDLWAEDIVRGSRNRKLVMIDCSRAITPQGVPEEKVDASMGDVHPEGNPHYWLDPENGALVADFLAKVFGETRPAQADAFRENARRFGETIARRVVDWEACLRGRSFVEYHDTWLYLANRFDMRIAGRVEPLPGISPTARQLATLSGTIRSDEVRVVVRDPFHSESPVEFLERETGVRDIVIPSVCEEGRPEAYLATFDRMCAALESADSR
ncbi:MAG: zinc ABC transporter substrate-binding protein [Gemmatimonadetes bacterium]|nr:zinc ABC transporter substrate-binding protein [Gemmatimonadota bacterium]